MSGEMIALYGAVGVALLAVVVYFLKRTMTRVDDHDKKISHIEKTYVEKPELTAIRGEMREDLALFKKEVKQETGKLAADIAEIKENYLREDNFYRSIGELSRQIEKLHDKNAKSGGN